MKNCLPTIFIALLLGTAGNALNAQAGGCTLDPTSGVWISPGGGPCTNTLISSVPFLRITPDARSAGMGDVGIAITPDANAMHFNASKLVFAEQDMSISATYSPWLKALGLQDVYMAYLSGYKRIDDLQAVGVSLRYFSLGEIAFTDQNGDSRGTGRPNEYEIAMAYARKLSPKFSMGLTGKFIYSNLAKGQQIDGIDIVAGTSGAVDISMTYVTEADLGSATSNITIGAAITNIGAKISYTEDKFKDFLPGNLGIGVAWDIDFDEHNRFTLAFDINKLLVPTPKHQEDPEYDIDPQDGIADHRQKSLFSGVFGSFSDAPNGFKEEINELMYSIGVEYWYDKQFAVRAGYYYENPTKGNRQFITAGVGLKYNIFGLNLSYLIPTSTQRSPLDNTLRFSLIFDIGGGGTVAVPTDG
jgi:Type IX secretion system protein PorV